MQTGSRRVPWCTPPGAPEVTPLFGFKGNPNWRLAWTFGGEPTWFATWEDMSDEPPRASDYSGWEKYPQSGYQVNVVREWKEEAMSHRDREASALSAVTFLILVL